MRVRRSLKNLIYGSASQAISSLLNFVVRYALIHTLGTTAVSLNGLFTEVLAVLSMAELGVGSAIVYHLYGPLKENDEERLTRLMNLFKTAYRLIALAVFVIGLALLPWVHLLVSKMEIDLGYLRFIYFLFLVQTASSYLFSYKTALLNADQKVFVVSQCTLIARVFSAAASIAFLFLTGNYIVYLLIQIITTVSINISVSARADRLYPFLKRKENLSFAEAKEILCNIKYLFIEVLSGKITNSTDNILISTMVGTLHIGAYSCYTMLIHAMSSLMLQLHHATTGSIGNLVAEGNNNYTETVLRRLTFITYCPTIVGVVGIYTVSTPFIHLLYGTDYLLPMPVVFVCVMNLLIYCIKNPLWYMMTVSGLFAQNKNISLTGDFLNLIVSILLGRKLGILGILLGTSCTLIIQYALKGWVLFRRFLYVGGMKYIALVMKILCTGIVCILCAQAVCIRLMVSNLYFQVLLYGICSVAITIGINFLVFHSNREFQYAVDIIKSLLGGKA